MFRLIRLKQFFVAIFITYCGRSFVQCNGPNLGDGFTLINRVQTNCEAEALKYGTRIIDKYQNFDENTEWDMRIHHDYLVEHMGFADWIQSGLWKSGGLTAHKNHAPTIYKRGGWAGNKEIKNSSYWALENKWIYMMGDSTMRQIWATLVSPFQSNGFERNAKEWTRDRCARQFPHRKVHPSGGYFPEEGWGGKCGNNEVTCHLSGYGPNGKITFDWKHFPFEDYDQWLYGEEGLWQAAQNESSPVERFPDYLVVQVGLHTCFHSWNHDPTRINTTMIRTHEDDIRLLMDAIHTAIHRPFQNNSGSEGSKTTVVIQTAGRIGNSDPHADACSWRFNRILAYEAHRRGFVVLEREELERRLQYKSEYHPDFKIIKQGLHLENPSPNIVGTSLLVLLSCLQRNGTDYNIHFPPPK